MKDFEFVNENKERIQIIVTIEPSWGSAVEYKIKDVVVIPYKKRKGRSLHGEASDDHKFRELPFRGEQRKQWLKDLYFQYVTEEQLQQAVQNAHESIKPTVSNTVLD